MSSGVTWSRPWIQAHERAAWARAREPLGETPTSTSSEFRVAREKLTMYSLTGSLRWIWSMAFWISQTWSAWMTGFRLLSMVWEGRSSRSSCSLFWSGYPREMRMRKRSS